LRVHLRPPLSQPSPSGDRSLDSPAAPSQFLLSIRKVTRSRLSHQRGRPGFKIRGGRHTIRMNSHSQRRIQPFDGLRHQTKKKVLFVSRIGRSTEENCRRVRFTRPAIMPLEAWVALLMVGFGRDADGRVEDSSGRTRAASHRVTLESFEQSDR
jgi:hypothetical protein